MCNNMDRYDVIVIGGGLLGCFTARALRRYSLKVALFEMREDLCTGISRANTAIVYSGCDTKPGTMKTSMCVRASQGFAQLCGELGVRFSHCGSIMVSFGERGDKVLRNKLEIGAENGVRGMRLLNSEGVYALEPNLAPGVHMGLYVPDTGTVMPWELCLAAAENASDNGAQIMLNTEVTGISRASHGGGYEVSTSNGVFFARGIINCAGMAADMVHEMAYDPVVRIVASAGDYFVLDTKAAGHIRHVIFHEPEVKGKGLTLVPTVDGNILVGPTERPGDDFRTEHAGLDELRELVSRVMPSLPMEHVIRSFGAVRPNPHLLVRGDNGGYVTDDKSVSDFCVLEADGGAFFSLVGVKTPGLTCANELGSYVADRMADCLGAAVNPAFDPLRLPPVRLSDLSFEDRELYTRMNGPGSCRIVCRCRGVSESEIVSAIKRFPGAATLDGVKRRTGAGSGRCQGSFCGQRVGEVIREELGVRS